MKNPVTECEIKIPINNSGAISANQDFWDDLDNAINYLGIHHSGYFITFEPEAENLEDLATEIREKYELAVSILHKHGLLDTEQVGQ